MRAWDRVCVEVIRVPHPERWWFARATDLPWLENPDMSGVNADVEQPRWADRDTRQWGAIAPIVDGLARTLSAGRYDVEDGRAVLHADLSALEETDRKIVRSWFQPWQAPSADTWSTTMSDGRHRCWNSWRAEPGALLPLSSALLEHADDVHEMSAENLRMFRDDAASGVATMPHEVAERAPLYLAELRRAASLEVPDDTCVEEARALSSPARVLPEFPASESLAKRLAGLLLARLGADPDDTRRPRGHAVTDHHRHRREDPPAGPAGRERS